MMLLLLAQYSIEIIFLVKPLVSVLIRYEINYAWFRTVKIFQRSA